MIVITVAANAFFPNYITGDAQNAATYFNYGLIRGIVAFGVGAIAFLIFDRYCRQFTVSSPILYGLLIALSAFFLIDHWPMWLPIVFYVLTGITLVALAANDGATWLSLRPLVFLGTISYSIYLLHIPIISALLLILGEDVVRGGGKAMVLAIVLLTSWASNRWIERPAQRLILNIPIK